MTGTSSFFQCVRSAEELTSSKRRKRAHVRIKERLRQSRKARQTQDDLDLPEAEIMNAQTRAIDEDRNAYEIVEDALVAYLKKPERS
jgi:hypothetical protein